MKETSPPRIACLVGQFICTMMLTLIGLLLATIAIAFLLHTQGAVLLLGRGFLHSFPRGLAFSLALIWCLSVDKDNQEWFFAHNAVQFVVRSFVEHQSSPQILQAASGALGMLAFNHERVRLLAVELDTLPLILSAMKDFAENVGVQAATCGALWNLSSNTTTAQWLIESGVLPTLTSTLRTFANDTDVQRTCTGVLWSLSAFPETRGAVVDAGGLDLALHTTHHFGHDSTVLWAGLGAVGSLCGAPSERLRVINSPHDLVLRSVLAAMQTHWNKDNLVAVGCMTLHNLAVDQDARARMLEFQPIADPTSKPDIPRVAVGLAESTQNVVELISNASQRTDEDARLVCCAALSVLTGGERSCGETQTPAQQP